MEAKLASGIPYVIRQNNPAEGTTSFHDELYGDITIDNSELDDMILIKSDGYPTYNFANVVDDHLMEITHVVRGNEYLSSTPKYNRLYEAFGWEIPVYVHLPLITDEEHKKLSKRSGHSSFEDIVEQGILAAVCVILFVRTLKDEFHLHYWETYLFFFLSLMPFTTEMPQSMATQQILTEGLSYALFYLFVIVMLKAVWTKKYVWFAGSLAMTFVLAALRSQLQILFAVCSVIFLYIVCRRKQEGRKDRTAYRDLSSELLLVWYPQR